MPLLPDRKLGPLQALNPYKLWLLVVLVSSLSLIGYVATRWLGTDRGTALTAITGGLVSSTAVTLSFSKQSRESGGSAGLDQAMASGILLAWTVMFARVGVMVAVIHPPLLLSLVASIGAMLLAVVLLVSLSWWRRRKQEAPSGGAGEVPLANPFSLTSAIKFAFFFALVLLLIRVGETYFAGQGLYVISILAGLTDIDAITLSVAGLAKTGTPERVAAICIVLASLSNTLVKCGFAIAFGSRGLGQGDHDGHGAAGSLRHHPAPLHPMRGLLATAPGEVELCEVPDPPLGPGDVIVRVRVALTCGTDLRKPCAGATPSSPSQ